MTDIIARLRSMTPECTCPMCSARRDAADEIERLRSMVGVERAAPPLRAREEIARALYKTRMGLNDRQISDDFADYAKDPRGYEYTRINVFDAYRCADAVLALSSTAGQEWREPLIEFARWAIRESVFEGTSIDGGSVQDKAQKLGLITETTYDPDRHGPSEAIAGDQWFVFAEPLLAEQRPEES
jgi:hypothetical protein